MENPEITIQICEYPETPPIFYVKVSYGETMLVLNAVSLKSAFELADEIATAVEKHTAIIVNVRLGRS